MKSVFKALAGNTLIFAIGNSVTLVLAFVMVPFYTKMLSPADFGISDIITTTTAMLVPLVSLNIFSAIFRFALDKSNPHEIFTNGVIISTIGSIASLVITGILSIIGIKYAFLVGVYLMVTLFLNLFQNFTRGINRVRSYAMSGVIATIANVVSNLLLMWVFRLGLNGYLYSLIIASIVTTGFLFINNNLGQYLQFHKRSWSNTKELLAYSIPMIPNSFAWWLTNDANKLIILFFMGPSANGILAVANKIPTMLTTFFNMFTNAWQMTAVEENGKDSTSELHQTVFTFVFGLLIIGCAIIVIIIQPFMKIYVDPKFFIAWKIVPILLMTSIFSNMSAFFGTTYLVAKKTTGLITTTLWGMLINVGLSLALVPIIGLNGAGISGSIGFLIVSLLRYKQTQKFVSVKVNWTVLTLLLISYAILSGLTITEQALPFSIGILIGMLLIFYFYLPKSIKQPLKAIFNR